MSGAGHCLAVIAKEPRPGHSKTRLCPPCTPQQAAGLAAAALRDTLETVARTPCDRRVLVLDGRPGPWLPPGFDVITQRGDGLAERLAAAFTDIAAPAFLVGMDTPQVTVAQLQHALRTLDTHDAALGLAPDGGYWGIGLHHADPAVFRDVPMSEAGTGAHQRRRLLALGLRVGELPALRDVDHIEDARAVARLSPDGHFARAVAALAPDAGDGDVAA